MRKCYAICDFLSEANKDHMRSVAEECGFEMSFFDSGEEAAGKIGDAEVAYCDEGELLREMPQIRWCHSVSAGYHSFISFCVIILSPRSQAILYKHCTCSFCLLFVLPEY